MGTNPWRGNHYVELTEDYSCSGNFAGSHTEEKKLVSFLKKHIGASDIPNICPPDDPLPTVKSPLTKANTFLLLEWIRKLRSGKAGHVWVTRRSYSYVAPSQSFLLTTSDGSILQNGSELVDIPLVDIQFYGSRINEYREELKVVGVMFEFREVCKYMGQRLMSLAANSNLTKSNVFSILKFIRLLGSWLKDAEWSLISVDSILFDSEWKVASQISSLPLIDNDYYGRIFLDSRRSLSCSNACITYKEATFLILECISHTNSSAFVKVLKDRKWLHTGVLKSQVNVFNGFPSISEEHYGPTIVSYKNELKQLGVVVDFDEAAEVFAGQFKQHASSSSITKENVLSFLECYKQLKKTSHRLPMKFNKCLREEKWLQTRLGTRVPKDSIMSHSDWESLSPIVSLPLIDDSDTGYGRVILEYRDELKESGVVAKFSSGMHFVVSGLNIPPNPSDIAPQSALSLMNCIKILLKENNALPEGFLIRVDRRWLKTSYGSLLLQPEDGPFIDDVFYCCKIASYSRELEAIGVTVDVKHGCSLIASHLESHSQLTVISRIYKCLCHFNWEPQKGSIKEPANEASGKIFIPNGSNTGDGFSQKNVTTKDLLDYFCSAFGIRRNLMLMITKLWNKMESTKQKITPVELESKTENLLSEKLLKLPVSSKDSDDVLLFDKDAILISDDLQLRDCLRSFPSVTKCKLNEIFANVGIHVVKVILRRYQMVNYLLDLMVFETEEPITASYGIKLCTTRTLRSSQPNDSVGEREMKLFTQKVDRSASGHRKMCIYDLLF
ncbi:hypothetical protein MKW92_047859 [Papaver armeniacum]|nr:hypothetical protein MKW92_047859 [Papaver armeniacum]